MQKAMRAPGEDELAYEVLALLPPLGIEVLRMVYNKALLGADVPEKWKTGRVAMLYKGKGEKSDVNSYRGLTLLNTTSKVFERILLARLTVFSEKYDLIHNNQNGFRPNRDCTGHLIALQQALEANPNARAVFVHIRKAYPKVFRPGLFVKLAQKGVVGPIHAAIQQLYEGLNCKVTVGGAESEEYEVENGLMEGALLSPWLYTIFINDLIERLERAGVGVKVGGSWVGALYYADDLVLVANTDADMQGMLDILDDYSREWKFQVSAGKTKVLRFGKPTKTGGGKGERAATKAATQPPPEPKRRTRQGRHGGPFVPALYAWGGRGWRARQPHKPGGRSNGVHIPRGYISNGRHVRPAHTQQSEHERGRALVSV